MAEAGRSSAATASTTLMGPAGLEAFTTPRLLEMCVKLRTLAFAACGGKLIAAQHISESDMKDDLLEGIKAIAAYLGLTEQRTYALHRGRHIPTTVIGRTVFARKSQLDRKFSGPED